MKMHFLKSLTVAFLSIMLVAACNQSAKKVKDTKGTTSDGKEASVEVEVFDAAKIKDQIVEGIENTPKPEEIAEFINKIGASYILDLTVAVDDIDKFMTETELSMAMGLYSFDLVYAKAFNRGDMVAKLVEQEKQIIEKLGLQAGHKSYADYSERIRANAENKDSLNALVSAMMNESYAKFIECEHTYSYALSFIAANIEGLYILSQLTLFAQNNAPMIEFLGQQGERAKSIFALLEMISGDENVKPYYEKMQPIAKYFEEHKEFTEKELKEVAPMIEALRAEIYQ